MSSWVRYSVAVYVGLLLAGALVVPKPEATAGPNVSVTETAPEDPAVGHNPFARRGGDAGTTEADTPAPPPRNQHGTLRTLIPHADQR